MSWERLNCNSESNNVGTPNCVNDFAEITGVIAVPKGTVIPADILEDDALLKAYLTDAALADDPNERFYFLAPFDDFTQANVEAQTQTSSNGRIRYTGKGFFAWDLTMWEKGSCAYKILLKFHQSQDKFDFINFHGSGSSAVLGLVKRPDANGDTGGGGVKMMQVFTPNWEMANGGSIGTKYMINFKVGDSEQMRTEYTGRVLSFDLADLMQGLIDVILTAKNTTGSTFLIEPTVQCSGESMVDTYRIELVLPQLWNITNSQTGQIIAVTSYNIVGEKVQIVLNAANPNYPAVGESVKFDWTVPSNLEGLGVSGYEAIAGYAIVSGS